MIRATSLAERRGAFGSTLLAEGTLLLRKWRKHRQSRRTIGTLDSLTDLQLKDIGLHRGDIHRRFGP